MKTHPMLFTTDMVKALLAGNKTQTRQIIKNQPPCYIMRDKPELRALLRNCKYQKGDLIYVRETYAIKPAMEYGEAGDPVYKADGFYTPKKWIPSARMPREYSRLTLKVTAVRIERIQDISESAATLEGITSDPARSRWPAFKHAWQSTYPGSWQRNDWVWVIDFEVIHQNVDHYLAAQENAA